MWHGIQVLSLYPIRWPESQIRSGLYSGQPPFYIICFQTWKNTPVLLLSGAPFSFRPAYSNVSASRRPNSQDHTNSKRKIFTIRVWSNCLPADCSQGPGANRSMKKQRRHLIRGVFRRSDYVTKQRTRPMAIEIIFIFRCIIHLTDIAIKAKGHFILLHPSFQITKILYISIKRNIFNIKEKE